MKKVVIALLYLTVALCVGINLVTSASVVSAEEDPIDNLVQKLNSDTSGLWVNGLAPVLKLPADARPEQVLDLAVKMTGFDQGRVKTYLTREVRAVTLNALGMDSCWAALIESDLGVKIMLFRYEGEATGWWTRFYDVRTLTPSHGVQLTTTHSAAETVVKTSADALLDIINRQPENVKSVLLLIGASSVELKDGRRLLAESIELQKELDEAARKAGVPVAWE